MTRSPEGGEVPAGGPGRYLSVALGVGWRQIHNAFTNPSLLLPSLIFPLFFLTAFAGGLSTIQDVPGFDFRPGYTAFQYVFVLLQSAAFGGVFTAFSIARDFETGFTRRLFLAAPHRSAIVVGYAFAAVVRALATGVVVTAASLLAGMQVFGSGVDLFGLLGLALLLNLAAAGWGTGVVMRLRSMNAAPLMQTPVFLVLFLAPVYVPLELLDGWIRTVAELNPVTALVEAGRSLLAGQPEGVAGAFAFGAALVAAFATWAFRGLRRAEAAGAG